MTDLPETMSAPSLNVRLISLIQLGLAMSSPLVNATTSPLALEIPWFMDFPREPGWTRRRMNGYLAT